MPERKDANRLALKLARSVLDAAGNLELEVGGTAVAIKVERLPQAPWPSSPLEGLDEATDGPWPRAVRAECSWSGGARPLLVEADYWKTRSTYRHLVSLRIRLADSPQELVWVTLALPLREATDHAECPIAASLSMVKRKGGVAEGAPAALKAVVDRSGLPLLTPYRVELGRVRLPLLEVLPSPAETFRRLIHLALLKLPFLVRLEPDSSDEVPFLPAASLASTARPMAATEAHEKLAGIWPLPGGVRQYKATLEALLDWVGTEPRSIQDFQKHVSERYDASGALAVQNYLRLLKNLGFVTESDDALDITEEGQAYRASRDSLLLFERFYEVYQGMLETLVLADTPRGTGADESHQLLNVLLGVSWQSPNQSNFRRNWLLSMGLTERAITGDVLSSLGREALKRHADEAAEIRRQVAELRDTPELDTSVASGTPDLEDDAEESEQHGKQEVREPDGWLADWLDLTANHVQPHLGHLELPPGILERACAALSSGKHLLLVGPPGTGKTELAHALANAARTEGYCRGLFEATASADWTTYETIGGYALERDHSLRFRAGAFLQAIEGYQWLLVDELNRADVDKSFGELMTVLAGRGTDTPFELEDGKRVSIGFEPRRTHRVSRTFRVIATMNTWDKTSLFRLSYAVQRRFAVIHLGVPTDEAYARLLSRAALDPGLEKPLDEATVRRLNQLFHRRGLLGYRDIGPAVALDVVRYMRRRSAAGDALAEALAMFLLPQFEGLEQGSAREVYKLFVSTLTGWTSEAALQELRARCEELWPPGSLPDA